VVTEQPPDASDDDRSAGTGNYRRTRAEPLTASWHLDPAELAAEGRHREHRRDKRSGFSWRVYAIPVLVLVTILVVANIAKKANVPASAPAATERAPVPVFTGGGTAVLPPGPDVPRAGAGTWHVVPGSGPVVGSGTHLYHYQVAVEDGIDAALYGGDDAFAHAVEATLTDPRGWVAAGTIALQRVDTTYAHPDFVVSLTTPTTDHRADLCGFDVRFEASCWRPTAHRVVVNLARWVRGALAFDGDLGLYRQYAINHEIGHVLGNQDVGCPTNGGLAPVMMPQTFGVSDDYLNQIDPLNRVPGDGKVCRVNAWPYPQGPGNPPS
jgi:uncharacterized protein DUF3152